MSSKVPGTVRSLDLETPTIVRIPILFKVRSLMKAD